MKPTSGAQSGRQVAAANVQKFMAWIEERDRAGDWRDYIRQGMLNRSEVAAECGFALSVMRQNPAVKTALTALEERLRASGTLGEQKSDQSAATRAPDAATTLVLDRRIMAAKAKAEQRIKSLEEQLAAARAEVRDLRTKLREFEHLDEHLGRTMRSPYP
jgi:chromosome segregation ATPase